MVKGISRRVIVVRSPDPRFFEEAIFIVKEDVYTRGGVSAGELLSEAQRVADNYVRAHTSKKPFRVPPLAFAAAGAAIAGILLLLLLL